MDMRRVIALWIPLTCVAIGLASCSSDPDDGSDTSAGGSGGSGGATPDAAPSGGGGTVDPYSGDCSSARWADVSDACWSCLCEGCAETLNACQDGCIELMQCALDKNTLVGDGTDDASIDKAIACEVRATRDLCLTDGDETTWGQAAAFDLCLIGAGPAVGQFRVCEAECGITYSGDVCDRYPEPDAG